MRRFLFVFILEFIQVTSFGQKALHVKGERFDQHYNTNRLYYEVYIGKNDVSKFEIRKSKDSIYIAKRAYDYSLIMFKDSSWSPFEGPKFENILDSIYFDRVNFIGDFYNKINAHLKSSLFIINTSFNDRLDFKGSVFEKKISFLHVEFNKELFLGGCEFKKDFTMDYSYFDEYSNMMQPCRIDFTETIFRGNASFNNVYFSSNLSFRLASFDYKPTFNNAILPKELDFSMATFHFPNVASLDSKIDFRKVNIDTNRTFLGIKIRPGMKSVFLGISNKCSINLTGTDANRFLLPFDKFYIVFPDNVSYEERVSTYEGVINSCKEAGMTESLQNWDIEYRKLQLNHDWPILGYYVIVFNELWWNFGYEKWKILIIWLPSFFLCFFIVNSFFIKKLYLTVYKDNEIGKEFLSKENERPSFYKLSYRVSYSLFYTAIIYFGLKLRHEAVNYKNFGGLLYLYLMYLVGAIHVAFALSYILSAY